MGFIKRHPFIVAFIVLCICSILFAIINQNWFIPVIENENNIGFFSLMGMQLSCLAYHYAAFYSMKKAKAEQSSKTKIMCYWCIMIITAFLLLLSIFVQF